MPDTDLAPVCALYYPHIHFRSLGWLKAALLYWEGVKRIVPESFVPQDPPEVRALVRAGLVVDVTPDQALRETAAKRFRIRLQELVQSRGGRRPWILEELDQRSGAIEGESAGLVHVAKLDYTLYRELVSVGKAVPSGDWVRLNPEMAGLYMIALAGEVGHRHHTAVISDSAPVDVACHYFASDGVGRDADAAPDGFALARLAVQYPSATGLDGVPVERVIAIREKYARERQTFREALQAKAASLATLPSAEAYRDFERQFAREMAHHVDALRDQAAAGGWALAHDFLGLSAPLGIAAALQLAAVPPAATGVAAAVAALTFVRHWFLRRRLERAQRAEQPWQYLLSLSQSDLAASGFENGMHQLVYD